MRTIIAVFLLCASITCGLFASGFAAGYQGKKILFIDSYHEGYAWSDGIVEGFKVAVKGKGTDVKIIHMDTKRNNEVEFKKKAALKAKAMIEEFKPDVVVAADDNASKYLIVPFYKDADLPFVFCGLNWDASVYGFPCSNVTGMVEVAPVPQLIEQLAPYAKGDRIGYLAPDILSARKDTAYYGSVFGVNMTNYFAKDMKDWQKGFVELQQTVDILVFGSHGGLYDDRREELKTFVEENTIIPTGAIHDFMAEYALIGFAKVAQEQGFWAGTTALRIIDGASPADIPVVKNKQGTLIVNTRIAEAAGIQIPFEMIQAAHQIIE
jgi:ABC-type uncharacterized transport system substrate-binding protein